MKFKYQYANLTERDLIISQNSNKYLIEELNITEGNFLVFTDVKPIELEIQELKSRTTATEDALLTLLMTV